MKMEMNMIESSQQASIKREMQIKITTKNHLIPITMATMKQGQMLVTD